MNPPSPTGPDRPDLPEIPEIPEIPGEVTSWIDRTRYPETATFPVERGYVWTSCSSVENGNPLFWDDKVAEQLTGGPIAPPTTLSLWFRPHHWEPDQPEPRQPLQVHFDLKEQLGLPEAVMTDSQVVFHAPVRPGDVIATEQVLRSVSGPKTTKLGTGRFWVIDVDYRSQDGTLVGTEIFTGFGYIRRAGRETPSSGLSGTAATAVAPAALVTESTDRPVRDRTSPASDAGDLLLEDIAPGDELPVLEHECTATTVVLGALATRDWRPMHHDVDFAVNRNGAQNIFLNTPNQQAWLERYVTDWTGPRGRLGRMRFKMLDSVYPGDLMRFTGQVETTGTDPTGCGWAELAISLSALAGGDGPARLCTTFTARVALPHLPGDGDDPAANPWQHHGDAWRP